jgi:hypothetical protein
VEMRVRRVILYSDRDSIHVPPSTTVLKRRPEYSPYEICGEPCGRRTISSQSCSVGKRGKTRRSLSQPVPAACSR